MAIIEQKRCSRREARIAIAERSPGYAVAAIRNKHVMDSSLSDVIASTVEQTMTKLLENLFVTLTESFAQILNAQIAQVLMNVNHPRAASMLSSAKEVNSGSVETGPSKPSQPITTSVEELYSSRAGPSNCGRKIIPIEHLHLSSDSGSQDSQIEFDTKKMKRQASPRKNTSPVSPKGKSKKNITKK